MPVVRVFITYEIVTPESAEHGDAEERGWWQPGGWHFEDKPEEPEEYEFRELVDLLRWCEPDSSHGPVRWATDCDSDINYQTGAEERHSYHPATTRDEKWFNVAARAAGIVRQ